METPKYITVTPPETVGAETADVFNELRHSGTPVRCPTCGEVHNITYKRGLYPALIRALKSHKNYTKSSQSDFSKLRFWGLIRATANGWMITDAGASFCFSNLRVPEFALIKNNVCIGYTGRMVSFNEALES